MASISEIRQWHQQNKLVARLVDIMTAGHTAPEIERFFAWLRANIAENNFGAIDWKSMRDDIASAAGGDAFRANVVLFFLLVADPLVTEYQHRRPNDPRPTFPRTKRPLTAHIDVATDEEFLIRVARYMNAPTSGIWHKGGAHCGTFYFYEPDSVTLLSCKSDAVLFAANKIHAAFLLLQRGVGRDELLGALRACHTTLAKFDEPNIAAVQSPAFKRFVLDLLDTLARGDLDVASHPMLQLAPWGHGRAQLIEDIDHTMRRTAPSAADTGVDVAAMHDLSPLYVGYTIWSRLDQLDVPLCTHGRQAGYELIVLQAEAGRHQAVTEILDTRPRQASFDDLVRLPIASPPDAVYDATAPAIYYPRTANYFIGR